MLTTHEVVTSEALGETLAGIQWDVMLLDQVLTHPLSIPVGTLHFSLSIQPLASRISTCTWATGEGFSQDAILKFGGFVSA